MVFKWLTTETQSAYIARPPSADGQLIYMHPDKSVPRGAKLTIRSDECALFFREGQFVNRLDAGTYLLDTNNVPFLGHLLVDKFTNANHFVTQIFFVTIAECVTKLPVTGLGQYIDQNSRNVVTVRGSSSYTLQIVDPVKLITQLGGQSDGSGETTIEVLNGRLLNGLRRIVGQMAESMPVMSVVSNTQAEAISEGLRRLAGEEFKAVGVELRRIFALELVLDEVSMNLIRDFGQQEAKLRIQSKGAEIAQQAGFAEYNIVQGQRAALEGLGKGLADGKGSMFMGMGLGGDLTSLRSPRTGGLSRPGSGAGGGGGGGGGGPVLSTPRNYFVQTANGETGPYSARQVALMIVSSKRYLSEVLIRGEDDPPDSYLAAELEPRVVAEYRRRAPAGAPQPASGGSRTTNSFDVAFDAAVTDGVISQDELSMLAKLAVSAGIAGDENTARGIVMERARARGVNLA
ncbi:MAG: SPFH domain-containing protein [Betaproteobacteria bacterium]|nr:SPFH domain-containing protein [Betaproteobacteria bacterium]